MTSRVDHVLDQQAIARKQDEVDAVRLTLHEITWTENKKELLKRLDHIRKLAKQKNYAKIEKLLQENYV